jgi:hypothetical protein
MAVGQSLYIFRGKPFIEYIDVPKFKDDIATILDVPKSTRALPFIDFYTKLIIDFPSYSKGIRKTFFENILYTHLKNVYLDKIESTPPLEVEEFKKIVKNVIESNNYKEAIPPNYYGAMNENGFHLMDLLNISVNNTSFIAGYDYEEQNGMVTNARFLYVEVIPNRSGAVTYFTAGIEIDFQEGIVLTMVKNVDGLVKQDEETHTTINQLRSSAVLNILNKLHVKVRKPNANNDRKSMFNFCKELDDKLLEEVRENLFTRTKVAVRDSVRSLNSVLFEGTEGLNNTDQNDLKKKITALLLGYYIDNNYKSAKLVRRAKDIKLVGYPTRINFASNKRGRSSTQSSNAKHPVSGSDMFHSLYFSFEQALGLDNWSISWFTDYTFSDEKNTDVIGTTIYSTTKQFRVVFLPTRPLSKEIIKYVIKTINSYRE